MFRKWAEWLQGSKKTPETTNEALRIRGKCCQEGRKACYLASFDEKNARSGRREDRGPLTTKMRRASHAWACRTVLAQCVCVCAMCNARPLIARLRTVIKNKSDSLVPRGWWQRSITATTADIYPHVIHPPLPPSHNTHTLFFFWRRVGPLGPL